MKVRVRVLRRAGVRIEPMPNIWHDALLETGSARGDRHLGARDPMTAPGKHLFPPLYLVQVVQVNAESIKLRGIENDNGAAVVQEWEVIPRV
jgi:hypothetical protein